MEWEIYTRETLTLRRALDDVLYRAAFRGASAGDSYFVYVNGDHIKDMHATFAAAGQRPVLPRTRRNHSESKQTLNLILNGESSGQGPQMVDVDAWNHIVEQALCLVPRDQYAKKRQEWQTYLLPPSVPSRHDVLDELAPIL